MSGRRPRHFAESELSPNRRRNRWLAGAATAAVHVLAIGALLWPHARPARPKPSLPPIEVSLVKSPRPKPLPPLEPMKFEAQLAPSRIPPPVFKLASPLTRDTSDLLSQSQLAGAAIAGEGGGGGCDISRAVQQALRHDPMVRTAVEQANRAGKAIMVWNGDWVRTGDQDGKGLAAVREAIMWEVAFAPQSCRNTRMHGLVLLSLADGATRFAVGGGEWRWSDLLGVRAR